MQFRVQALVRVLNVGAHLRVRPLGRTHRSAPTKLVDTQVGATSEQPKGWTLNSLNFMNDWIGLAVMGLIVVSGLVFLVWLSRPYEVTTEEFEKRAAEAPSLLSAGFVGLQKILDPATTKAVIAQEDFREGRFDAGQAKGDGPEAGDE